MSMTRPDTDTAVAASAADLLTPDLRALLSALHDAHDAGRRSLLARRTDRAAELRAGAIPGLLPETADIRAADWVVRPAPDDLQDRRCEITGPATRKLMVGALNSGARVFMADLEDSLTPRWATIVDAHRNIRDAAAGTLSFQRSDDTVDTVCASPATLVVRPRGLHLDERHAGDGVLSASLFDTTVAAFHAGRSLTDRGSGLYLYLPKLESHREAAWWDVFLADLEARLGLEPNGIRVTVLIETILAAFEMEEILYALRGRITALNAGRWDYIFSVIKRLGHDPDHVLPDRAQVTMTVPFMAAYAERLVDVCHRRGAHAIGGMSAFIPNRNNPEATDAAMAAVRADKEREAALGYDGTWVAHPDLVDVATAAFDDVLGERVSQLDRRPSAPPDPSALLDTTIDGATVTRDGLRSNVAVALQYLAVWLAGTGAVAIADLMEDLATAEIARSQLWQWIHHGTRLDDGTVVTAALVQDEIDDARGRLADEEGHDLFDLAASILADACLQPELPEFLSTLAEGHLA